MNKQKFLVSGDRSQEMQRLPNFCCERHCYCQIVKFMPKKCAY